MILDEPTAINELVNKKTSSSGMVAMGIIGTSFLLIVAVGACLYTCFYRKETLKVSDHDTEMEIKSNEKNVRV